MDYLMSLISVWRDISTLVYELLKCVARYIDVSL